MNQNGIDITVFGFKLVTLPELPLIPYYYYLLYIGGYYLSYCY